MARPPVRGGVGWSTSTVVGTEHTLILSREHSGEETPHDQEDDTS